MIEKSGATPVISIHCWCFASHREPKEINFWCAYREGKHVLANLSLYFTTPTKSFLFFLFL